MSSEEEKPEFYSENYSAYYLGSVIIAGAICFCFYKHANNILIAMLIVMLIPSVLHERYNILVYKDRFIIREDYLPGSLMRVDKVYYFKDIKQFSSSTNIWKPRFFDWIGITIIYVFLPKNFTVKTEKKIFLEIQSKNSLNEIVNESLVIPLQDKTFLKLVEIIERRTKKN